MLTDSPLPPPTAESLRDLLLDARRVELELAEGLSEAQMLGTRQHFVEPPIWEIGHVGWFQEYWVLRHLDGVPSLLPGSDGIYDSFNVSYTRRWEHRFPAREATLTYIAEVLHRSIARLDSRQLSPSEAYFYTLAALHEDMHAENLALIRQTLGYPRPPLSSLDPAAAAPTIDPAYQPRVVDVRAGTFMLGASPDEPFVFDNEKWAHPVEVAPFRISSTPVTNADYEAFVADGGYGRRELWGRRGWDWRRRERAEAPLFWVRGNDSPWHECLFGCPVPLDPWGPAPPPPRGARRSGQLGRGRRRPPAGRAVGFRGGGRGKGPPASTPPREASGASRGATSRRPPSEPVSTTARAGRSMFARYRP